MSRLNILDSIRGISFIPMCIFHIFSTYDLANDFQTNSTSNMIVYTLGLIRNVYIVMAGISLAMSAKNKKSKNEKDYYISRIKRSTEIFVHAFIITIVSHYLYPNFGIKFGILHFIGLGTLLLSPIADNRLFLLIALCAMIYIYIYSVIPPINPTIDTITGATIHYNTADWFPLNANLPLLITGVILGNMIDKKNETIIDKKNENTSDNKLSIFEWMGRHSLELYTGHVVILMVLFYLIKKFKK